MQPPSFMQHYSFTCCSGWKQTYVTVKMNHNHNIWIFIVHSINKLLFVQKRDHLSKLLSGKRVSYVMVSLKS